MRRRFTAGQLVIRGDRFAEALYAAVSDEAVRRLPRWLGNTTQWVDRTDVPSSRAGFGLSAS